MNFKDLLEKMAELDSAVPAEDKYLSQSDTDVEEGGMEPAKSNAEEPLMGDYDVEEGNEFSGELAKARASGAKEFSVDGKTYQVKEDGTVEECGGMMSPMGSMSSMAPKQPDNVTMNVSMNGSGSGGIKDLLDILRNIEKPSMGKDADAVMVGMEEFANEPNSQVAGTDAVTPTGDDLHSKGAEAEKVNGGGNPMQPGVSESLVSRLAKMYDEIKEGRADETMYFNPQTHKEIKKSYDDEFNRRHATDKENERKLRAIGKSALYKPGMADYEVDYIVQQHQQSMTPRK